MKPNSLIAATAALLLLACSGSDAEIGSGAPAAASAKQKPATAPALSSLHMADPAAAAQLAAGFHGIEQSAWRWTQREFSVNLKAPAASTAPQLKFRFAISPVVMERLKSLTLTASTGGNLIGSESYAAAGEYVFSKALPPAPPGGDTMQIDFELDRAVPAGDLETRELGVIAISVGLE